MVFQKHCFVPLFHDQCGWIDLEIPFSPPVRSSRLLRSFVVEPLVFAMPLGFHSCTFSPSSDAFSALDPITKGNNKPRSERFKRLVSFWSNSFLSLAWIIRRVNSTNRRENKTWISKENTTTTALKYILLHSSTWPESDQEYRTIDRHVEGNSWEQWPSVAGVGIRVGLPNLNLTHFREKGENVHFSGQQTRITFVQQTIVCVLSKGKRDCLLFKGGSCSIPDYQSHEVSSKISPFHHNGNEGFVL